MRMDIELPHLAYTVRIRPIVKVPADMVGAPAWCEIDDEDQSGCTLRFGKSPSVTTILHELVHAVQHMCQVRHIDFARETESMAYTMQYLLMRVLGHEWEQTKPKR